MPARFPVSPSPSCFHFPDYFLRINTCYPPVSSCLSGNFSLLLVLYLSQCVLYLYVSQFPLLDVAFFLSAFCLNPSVDGSLMFGSATQHSGCFSCRGAFQKWQPQWILLLIRSRVHGGFDPSQSIPNRVTSTSSMLHSWCEDLFLLYLFHTKHVVCSGVQIIHFYLPENFILVSAVTCVDNQTMLTADYCLDSGKSDF